MNTFILVSRDVGYCIIGPFADSKAAGDWATAHWDEDRGDPRWRVLDIDGDANAPPRVLDSATAEAQAAI